MRSNTPLQSSSSNEEKTQFSQICDLHSLAQSQTELIAVLKQYDDFIRQYPQVYQAYQNRSDVLQHLGLYDLAMRDANKVLELAPDFALGHCNKAFLHNILGEYLQGWAEYEWRWQTDVATFADKGWPIPRWQGQAYDKKMLIYAEQGFGDNIQFVRFAIEAKQRGLNIIVVNHQPIENLLNYNLAKFGVETASNGSAIADLTCHISMMSLPHFLQTELHSIPYSQGYLQAEPEFLAKWQQKVTACSRRNKMQIGVVWSGSAKHDRNAVRSLSFALFSSLFSLDADFHCLQKEINPQDKILVDKIENLFCWDKEIETFSDTAGLIAQMDLVISVDTSVAHLAGAMAKPTWILLSYHPDFRWLIEREDSPWYHSVRLFRQTADYQWHTVIDHIMLQLKEK